MKPVGYTDESKAKVNGLHAALLENGQVIFSLIQAEMARTTKKMRLIMHITVISLGIPNTMEVWN